MKKSFIQFTRYEGLDIYENLLLGLIEGLSQNGKKPCFSNAYASTRIGVSTRKISSIITNFINKGLITIYFDGRKRFIYLKELPNIITFDTEVCALKDETTQDNLSNHDKMSMVEQHSIIEPYSTQDRTQQQQGRTAQHSGWNETASSIEPGSIYNKGNKKGNNKEEVPAPTLDFNTLFSLYPSTQEPRCRKDWTELNEKEKQDAIGFIEIYDLYLSGGSRKPLYFYLEDREWNKPKYQKVFQTQASQLQEQLKRKKQEAIWTDL